MTDAAPNAGSAQSPLAVVCGGGSLPFAVADAAIKDGRRVVLIGLRGFADAARIAQYPHHWVTIGQAGRFFRLLNQDGCRELVFIGNLVRPTIGQLRLDVVAIGLLLRFAGMFRGGDSHILRHVIAMVEERGLRVIGAHEIAPHILVPEGSLGSRRPGVQDQSDIARGLDFLRATGPFDVGQAVVVAQNRIVCVEAAEGTDHMLARLADLRRSGEVQFPSGTGVLVKGPKPGQDRRIDLPSIGPRTIENARQAGLGGIAVVADSAIMAEPQKLAESADRANVFVVGVCDKTLSAVAEPPPDNPATRPLDIFMVAGEESGDRLGAALMRSLKERRGDTVQFSGVGGREMAAEGITSLYSIDDLSLIGFKGIPRRLLKIWRLVRLTVAAIVARRPHMLVIIDSPDFTCAIARRVRAADPSIAIVEFVSPSVWAWRPGRAPAMRRYIDHILALLPFEPAVHERLGGPPCTYVGHPMAAEVDHLRPSAEEAHRRLADPPVLLVLPGSRRDEVERHAAVFGETVARVVREVGTVDVVVPAVPHLREQIERAIAQWPVRPRIVTNVADRQAAFRIARGALTKSGTVTLELALAGVPMVAAYRVSPIEAAAARLLVDVSSVILANIVLGQSVVPQFLQENCTADQLAPALVPLLSDTPERRRQVAAFVKLDAIMEIGNGSPAQRAADIVLDLAGRAGAARRA
jgi:lipid-A-disaccharide synthase